MPKTTTIFLALFLVVPCAAVAFDNECGKLPMVSSREDALGGIVSVHTEGEALIAYFEHHLGHYVFAHVPFEAKGKGFVVGGKVLTSRHLLEPETMWVDNGKKQALGFVKEVVSRTITVEHVRANIDYIHHRRDFAVLALSNGTETENLPYAITETWEAAGEKNSVSTLRPGNCVMMLKETGRHEEGIMTAVNPASDIDWINDAMSEETFTASVKGVHGDSGRPVVAFQNGVAHVIGIMTATRFPYSPVSFIVRTDTLIPFLDALKHEKK